MSNVELGQVKFRVKQYSRNDAYCPKYEVAYLGDEVLSRNGFYLSRISKSNGQHRYYVSMERERTMCNGCGEYNCSSEYCRGAFTYTMEYKSKYVGKNLNVAYQILSNGEFNLEWEDEFRQTKYCAVAASVDNSW